MRPYAQLSEVQAQKDDLLQSDSSCGGYTGGLDRRRTIGVVLMRQISFFETIA